MIPLSIPASLPPHTRTWLSYLDSAIAERVGPEMVDRIEEARRQQSYARMRVEMRANSTPNLAYFLNLYADLLSDQQLASARRSVSRMVPRIPARESA